MLHDTDSIESHTALLPDRVNFLTDVTVGSVNINQSKIVKLFSVVSVVLMSSTLIAPARGINSKAMPKLDWAEGYLYAIVMMVMSVTILPVYFRRKGWLKQPYARLIRQRGRVHTVGGHSGPACEADVHVDAIVLLVEALRHGQRCRQTHHLLHGQSRGRALKAMLRHHFRAEHTLALFHRVQVNLENTFLIKPGLKHPGDDGFFTLAHVVTLT